MEVSFVIGPGFVYLFGVATGAVLGFILTFMIGSKMAKDLKNKTK